MLNQAQVRSRLQRGLFVVDIRGDVDARNAHRLRIELEAAAARLKHTIYLDSRALALLASARAGGASCWPPT